MKLGVFLPISGHATGPDVLLEAAQSAEAQGFDAIWSADRVVTPWSIKTSYPYSENHEFIVPPDRPFLDSLTCLAFLAGCTKQITLGISVGWMEEEFAALAIPFKERGRITDEQLQIIAKLWAEEHVSFHGHFYDFQDLAFFPKPVHQAHLPLWIGGEGTAAQQRSALHGDAWFPYFVKISPSELKAGYDNVRRFALKGGRDPEQVRLACCRPIEVTNQPVVQDESSLRGTPEQLREALQTYREIGVDHLALQFMAPRWPDRAAQIEQFAREVMPSLRE